MHYCTFVIIGPQGDPDALVAGTLAPFDEALAVPAAIPGDGHLRS